MLRNSCSGKNNLVFSTNIRQEYPTESMCDVVWKRDNSLKLSTRLILRSSGDGWWLVIRSWQHFKSVAGKEVALNRKAVIIYTER